MTAPRPTPMRHCEICGETTDTPPVCARCDAEEDSRARRREDV